MDLNFKVITFLVCMPALSVAVAQEAVTISRDELKHDMENLNKKISAHGSTTAMRKLNKSRGQNHDAKADQSLAPLNRLKVTPSEGSPD